MALKIGITGGIGSGKSTICRVFNLLGAPIFEADKAARELMDSERLIRQGLIGHFGKNIYKPDGCLDRSKLASHIFNDQQALNIVNHLVHPQVRAAFASWADQQEAAYVIHEAAILFESGLYKTMDFCLLVSAPEETRIKRVCQRDGISPQQVKERMGTQWPDKQKRPLANIEIINDNSELILPQIIKIDKQLKEYGKIW